MNVGKLYACLNIIREEYDNFEIIEKLKTLQSSLQQSVSQPNEETAKNFRDNYSNLFNALSESWSNFESPTRIKTFDDIEASSKIGQGLMNRIEKIISNNNITPASALKSLSELVNEIEEFSDAIEGVVEDFEFLNFKYEDIKSGEYEIGVSFPMKIIKSNLEGVSKETNELDRVFKTFKEIAEDDTSSIKIRSISTTDLQVFLDSAPIVAALIATSLERIVALYKNILEIKKIKNELVAKKTPKDVITPLEKHEAEIMKRGIKDMSENLVDEFYKQKDDGRKNELKVALGNALRYLAEKIEHGAIFDVRAGEPEEPESTEGEEETPQYKKAKTEYLKEMKHINQINSKGRSVAELQKGDIALLLLKSKKKDSENKK